MSIARDGAMHAEIETQEGGPFAFVGLRSCDLHAIAVQDRVFMDVDPAYRRRREESVFPGIPP